MEKEVDAEIIKATQESLGRFIKRPQLTEKLLRKPPFRFLHDIVTSVLKSTGFFEGLFGEYELISENVKDRESKIAFLNKVIAVLVHTTGKSLNVKSSKIVAGQEAEKTNDLLQCLAYALDRKLSSRDAIEKIKENNNISDSKVKKSTKATKKDSKLTSKSSENLELKKESNRSVTKADKTVTKTSNSVKVDATSKKEPAKSKKDTPQKQNKSISESNKKQSATAAERGSKVPVKQSQTRNDTKQEHNNDEAQISRSQSADHQNAIIHEIEVTKDEKKDENFSSSNNVNPSQAIVESKKSDVDNDAPPNKTEASDKTNDTVQRETISIEPAISKTANETEPSKPKTTLLDRPEQTQSETKLPSTNPSLVKSSSEDSAATFRPGSARPGSVRPSSARPAAPRPRDKHEPGADTLLQGRVNIIPESTKSDEEGDTSIVIVDPKLDEDAEEESSLTSSNYRGHLVQQILDSQKEFSESGGKTEIELQIGSVKGREATNQDIEQLRFNIQALSRAANPLGKLLDHIQEDVEVMRQELQQWTKTYEDVSSQLMKEKTANEESLVPMHTKVKQLDADIKEKNDKINDLKMEIRKNAARIDKLLASGNQ